MPTQIPLPIQYDIRVPQNYYRYWVLTGTCYGCYQDIRHELHLYNHYKKYHFVEPKPRFFYWNKYRKTWLETSSVMYWIYRKWNIPTARTK